MTEGVDEADPGERSAALDSAQSLPEAIDRTRVEPGWDDLPDYVLPTTPRRALLGRYSLLRKLGEGGMGVVYSAYDEELDRRVAIKLLRVHAGSDGAAASRMLREAQLMAKLSHPNVVQAYDVGVLSSQVFLAMEFVQGPTLREWLHGSPDQPRPPRPWPEVLAMYIQAGHGLAAAHAAGLVHRDFKPDNVLVGADGRARVLDFGLARSDARSDTPTDDNLGASERSGDDRLESTRSAGTRNRRTADRPLTVAGTLIGTPAYMSPEQHLRVATDARSDQFSFCVALYEGMYGERPFTGDTAAELRRNVLAARVRDPPPGRKVPAWLRKILLRGLRTAPDDRFPSMDALLAALATDPGRIRRRWLAGLATVAVALATGLALAQRRDAEAEVCRADQLLVGVWDVERAAAVQAALAATGLTYARDSWPKVQEQLDMYAKTWRDVHVEICQATNLHRSQSERLMDLRMACLAERRAELRAVVDVLAEADAQVAERAVQTVTGLRPLARCADTTIGADPELAPAILADLQQVRAKLAQARAEDDASRYARGLPIAQDAVVAAERIGYRPALAEALLQRGRLESGTVDFKAAEASLEAAYWLAEAAGDDRVRIGAATRLLELTGERLGRDHDGMQWGRQAEALLHRLGDPPEFEAPLRSNLAIVHTRYGRYDEALAQVLRAIELGDRPGDPRLANYQRQLGNVYFRLGHHAEAEAAYLRAVALGEAALGPDHPDVGRSVSNLGEVQRVQGHTDAAERSFRRAIAIWERSFGPDHPLLASASNGLGNLAMFRGDLTSAAAHFDRVRVLLTRSSGPNHPDVGAVTSNLGEVLLYQGELSESRRHSERALEILESALGPDHDALADALCNLGRALTLQGDLQAAAAPYARAVALLERIHGPEFGGLAKPLTGQGLLALARGRPGEAVTVLERALALPGPRDATRLAELRLALARALWDARVDRPRARTLAELARTELQAAGPTPARAPIAEALGTWLSEHPPA